MTIPLSLYIHIPWCIRKCPYCDFNSHRAGKEIPEQEYIDKLLQDLEYDKNHLHNRKIQTIFIGGGTPSLFSAAAIDRLINELAKRLHYAENIEITMEANPGTFEQKKFTDFRKTGINRLSIGVQSFQAEKLKSLGRVHNAEEAQKAIMTARNAGFDNINLDLMHGLPNQSEKDALYDLTTAISFSPQHLSWYQLTLEPDTVFAKHPPRLPVEETLWNIQELGTQLLAEHGYQHYEISAYSKPNHQAKHNLNYWTFGDYLGIGAGAHSKITDPRTKTIRRFWKIRNPNDYLSAENFIGGEQIIMNEELPLEFMMNTLRLIDGIPLSLFAKRTGLSLETIAKPLQEARNKGLLEPDDNSLKTTALGQRFLNDCVNVFSEEKDH